MKKVLSFEEKSTPMIISVHTTVACKKNLSQLAKDKDNIKKPLITFKQK
jgi:hypothetical protein